MHARTPDSTPALNQGFAPWRRPANIPTWGAWLLVLVASLALLLAYSQWSRLNNIQEQLALQSSSTQTQAIEARALSQQAQALAQDAAARAALGEARINEYTLQRTHLEQLAFELSRTRDEALLIDIETSLRLAQQQAQLTGLADPLIAALRNAQQRLERTEQARLSPVLQAIDRDLARLTSMAVTDTAGLLGRIDTLLLQLEQIPLGNMVGQMLSQQAQIAATATNDALPKASAEKSTQDGEAAAANKPADTANEPAIANGVGEPVAVPSTGPDAAGTSVERRKLWSGLRESFATLVRVQRIDHPDAALLSQEQAFFLRENMRLQLMNARMGLLARQSGSARADLALVQASLLKYFDLGAPRTQQALRTLQQLQDHILSVQPPAITETLAAMGAVHSSRSAVSSAAPNNESLDSQASPADTGNGNGPDEAATRSQGES